MYFYRKKNDICYIQRNWNDRKLSGKNSLLLTIEES